MAAGRALLIAGLSVALHGAAGVAVCLLRVPPSRTRPPISITIRDPAPSPSPRSHTDEQPAQVPVEKRPPRLSKAKAAGGSRRTEPHVEKPVEHPPVSDEPKPPGQTPPKVDLAHALMGAATRAADASPGPAFPRDPGGRTGRSDPNAPRDPAALGAEAKQTIDGFLDEDKSRQRVKSGNVPPRWFDVGRVAQSHFVPSPSTMEVSDAGAVARSILNPDPPSGAGAPPEVPGGPANPLTGGLNGGFNAPAQMGPILLALRRTEIEVVVEPDGSIRSSRIARKSGSRAYDTAALAEVERAVRELAARHDPLDEKGPVRLRWAVESRREMPRPTMGNPLGLGFGGGGQPIDIVGRERTRSEVTLLAYAPVKEGAAMGR
mgnify:CR=1 FL=1